MTKAEFLKANGYDITEDIFNAVHEVCEVVYYSHADEIFEEYEADPVETFKEFCEEYGIMPGSDDWEYVNKCHAASWLWECKTLESIEDLND